MSDEKKKCNGCGRDITGELDWCMSCRSILYTDLLIARTDFSGSQFKTLVFPVRDIIWMQDRIRLREAELKAADDTNDMIAAELARLRAALAEAERERDEARKRSETLWNILRVKIDGEKSDIGRDYYEKDTRSWSQYRRKQRHNDAERELVRLLGGAK